MSKIRNNAFWIAAGDFSGRGFAFLTTIYLARTLGPEYYGLITVAVSILGYATWTSDLGLLNIGIREISKEPENRIFRAKEIFNLKVILAGVVLIFATIVLYSTSVSAIQKQVILGYLYSLIPYALLLEWFYSGKQQFWKITISRMVNGIIYLGLVYLMIQAPEDVTIVPVLYTLGIISAVVILGTFSISDQPFTLPSRGFSTYFKLIKQSSVVGVGGFFAQVVQLLPPILIGIFLSLEDAGLYGAAFKVILIAMMVDRVFVNLLLPNLSSLWNTNKESAIQKINMALKLLIVGGILITLLVAINSGEIIALLFGNGFDESTGILKILSGFIFLTFINSLFSFGLIATNSDKKYMIATVLGGTISALLIFALSRFGNSETVAASVVISELVLTVTSYIWFKKIVPVKVFRPVLLMIIFSGLLFFLFEKFEIHYLIASLITVFVIPIFSWNTRVIRIGELNWLKEKLLK